MNVPATLALMTALSLPRVHAAQTLSWSELSAEPLPAPAPLIAYGKERLQFGELRLPRGKGPHPVVVVVHGGCWLNGFDYVYITRVSQALAEAGYAAWTPEYRRIGDAGGGWPGTFLDVAAATDHLRMLAKKHPLDLDRVIALGHSAGGHLALWLAARPESPKKNNPLHAANPLKLHGVVGLAAITDLREYSMGPQDGCNGAVRKLMGGMPEEVARRYKLASPVERRPYTTPVRLVHGLLDSIVPLQQSLRFAAQAKAVDAKVIELRRTGHFELTSVRSRAWSTVLAAVRDLQKTD